MIRAFYVIGWDTEFNEPALVFKPAKLKAPKEKMKLAIEYAIHELKKIQKGYE